MSLGFKDQYVRISKDGRIWKLKGTKPKPMGDTSTGNGHEFVSICKRIGSLYVH